jgi:hypothetical protein
MPSLHFLNAFRTDPILDRGNKHRAVAHKFDLVKLIIVHEADGVQYSKGAWPSRGIRLTAQHITSE